MKMIKRILILLLAFAFTLSFAACGDDSDIGTSEDESAIGEASDDDNSDVSDAGDASTEASGEQTEDTSGNESADPSDETSDEDAQNDESSESESYTGDNSHEATSSTETSIPDDEPDEESSQEEESMDEMIGSGTKNDPYMEIPNLDNMTVKTVSIGASKSVYYGIYRIGGMIVTVNDKDAYIVYEGTRYNASNGVVTLTIANALASDAIYLEVGNSGSAAKEFTISFTNPTGSFMNPTVVKSIGSDVSISLEAGIETGHYYKYIAEKNGVLRFYKSSDAESVMLITNNRNSAQISFEEKEEGAEYVEIEVTKGDEIIINVGAKPNKRGKYPAADIVWRGEYK